MNRCRAECSPNTSLSMLAFVEAKYNAIYDLHLLLSLVDRDVLPSPKAPPQPQKWGITP